MRKKIEVDLEIENPTPEQIAEWAETDNKIHNIQRINAAFLKYDQSDKWPIQGLANATKLAIGRMRRVRRFTPMYGLEYALALDAVISKIVNEWR